MTDVGIKAFRDHLSAYLDRVKAGEEFTVTDRGRAVAVVVPAGERTIDRLIREGRVTPARDRDRRRHLPPPIKTAGTVSDLVIEDRG